MHPYHVTLETYEEENSKRVTVQALDEYDAMATAQMENPGWHPVQVVRHMDVRWMGAK